jgi:WD40 repeat protein
MESKTLWREKAHNGIVRGITFLFSSVTDPAVSFLSCGDDKQIKLWTVNTEVLPEDEPITMSLETEVCLP